MAPEMFVTARRGSPVDIILYALGCTMIEAYGRKRVWEGLTSAEIMQNICGPNTHSPSVNHLPAIYVDIILCQQCCDLDQSKQPKATEILQFLNEIEPDMD
jgi:hypothetical protein